MDDNKKNNNNNENQNKISLLSAIKIFVYGIISPSIITFGIYYTFTIGIKYSIKNIIKEAITESFDISLTKNMKEIFKKN